MFVWTDLLGYIAGFLTTVAFVPQVIRTIKTKDTRSISLKMYIIFSLGVFCWFSYGLVKGDKAIIITNMITALLALIVLVNKIRNDVL